jgi:hypothetical protein
VPNLLRPRTVHSRASPPITHWDVLEAGGGQKSTLVVRTCAPVARLPTAGQVGDNPQLAPMLEIYPNWHGGTMRLLAVNA